MARVTLNMPLLTELTGAKRLHADGRSVTDVLEYLDNEYPGFKERLLKDDGSLQGYILLTAKYEGESSSRIVKDPQDARTGLLELFILPVPHGG